MAILAPIVLEPYEYILITQDRIAWVVILFASLFSTFLFSLVSILFHVEYPPVVYIVASSLHMVIYCVVLVLSLIWRNKTWGEPEVVDPPPPFRRFDSSDSPEETTLTDTVPSSPFTRTVPSTPYTPSSPFIRTATQSTTPEDSDT